MRETIDKILELQNAKGSIQKKAIIRMYEDDDGFLKILYYALNPMMTYKVTKKTLEHLSVKKVEPYAVSVFRLCDYLDAKKALSDQDLNIVGSFLFLTKDPVERQFYIDLLSKTLRLGVTAKTVNEVIPNLIPVWEVQQAYPIEKYPLKPDTWFTITEKLNGVRATFYKGKLYARSGVPFEGLDHITRELELDDGFVFDGELVLKEKSGLTDNEAFRKATGIINSDAEDKQEIVYRIFDMMPVEEFDGTPVSKYSRRRDELNAWANQKFVYPWISSLRIVPELYQGTDQTQIAYWLDWAVAEDKEGVMINLDVPYQRKRHRGILKVKRFYTMDLTIIRCEEGSGRLAGTLGALVVDYKGNEVNVGSGFTDEQREDFWTHRDELPGVLCEVKYKEISADKKTGAESLQFPIFVSLRADKEEPNYDDFEKKAVSIRDLLREAISLRNEE